MKLVFSPVCEDWYRARLGQAGDLVLFRAPSGGHQQDMAVGQSWSMGLYVAV